MLVLCLHVAMSNSEISHARTRTRTHTHTHTHTQTHTHTHTNTTMVMIEIVTPSLVRIQSLRMLSLTFSFCHPPKRRRTNDTPTRTNKWSIDYIPHSFPNFYTWVILSETHFQWVVTISRRSILMTNRHQQMVENKPDVVGRWVFSCPLKAAHCRTSMPFLPILTVGMQRQDKTRDNKVRHLAIRSWMWSFGLFFSVTYLTDSTFIRWCLQLQV